MSKRKEKNVEGIDTSESVKQLEEQLKKQEEQIKDLTDTLQRLQAEYENYGKRADKEKLKIIEYAGGEFVKELLPFLDSFDAVIVQLKKSENTSIAGLRGIEILHKQLLEILKKQGLKEIETGKKFDHEKHEVVMVEENKELEDGKIIEELQKGYEFRGVVIRHSKVKINKLGVQDQDNNK